MKKVYKFSLLSLVAVLSVGMASCKPKAAQGVTDEEIIVGNTATESGSWAIVGKPFNNGLRAYLEAVNVAGGVDGRTIRLINRDDGFNATTGLANTEALVEDDKVFALVGHFGTPTVAATVNYIKEMGVPMVYAATGDNSLYQANAPLSPVMPVQPIYRTEGKLMLARVLAETEIFGSGLTKIAVIHSLTGDGISMKDGIAEQATALGATSKVVYFPITSSTDYSSTVALTKSWNPDVIIVAANQAPFMGIYGEMKVQSLNKRVITSYVNASTSTVRAADYSADRPIYVGSWLDTTSTAGAADLTTYSTVINAATGMTSAEKTDALVGFGSSYAMAGYVAAHVFVAGLKAVAAKSGAAKVLNWENYIKAMEDLGPIAIPMGGAIDFSTGKRLGIEWLSLLKYVPAEGTTPASFAVEKPVSSLASIVARIA